MINVVVCSALDVRIFQHLNIYLYAEEANYCMFPDQCNRAMNSMKNIAMYILHVFYLRTKYCTFSLDLFHFDDL